MSIEEGDFKITIKQDFTGQPQQYVMAPAPVQHVIAAPAPQQAGEAAPAAPKAAAPSESNANHITIKSPMIGTFYRSPSPDKPVFVNVGDEIKKGATLCIIEAMKLFNEIESEVKGTIVKVLVDDASPVEFDQPLFLVQPA